MNRFLPESLTHERFVELLEAHQHEDIMRHCQAYIRERVRSYLRHFPAYQSNAQDYLQDVYVHLLTKTLPSEAFKLACKSTNSFHFYLAKSIRNCLNTKLSQEKALKHRHIAIEYHPAHEYEERDADKDARLKDSNFINQSDYKDLLQKIQQKLDEFLNNFGELFPKISHKLWLLLKINARAEITQQDLSNCFIDIPLFEVQNLLYSLGNQEEYSQKEDIKLYEIIYPYFQRFRHESGSPAALQRWLNLQISGDEKRKGILDYLVIQENSEIFRINDKKVFADFLLLYFKYKAEAIEACPVLSLHKPSLWQKIKSGMWLSSAPQPQKNGLF